MVENTVWYLKHNRLFDRVDGDKVHGYAHLFVQRDFPKRSILFQQGDEARLIYLLKRGKVRIGRTTEDGKEITLAVLGAGDIFGEEVVFGEHVKRTTQATCIGDSYICMARMEDLFGIMSRHPVVMLNIAKYLREQRDEVMNTVEEISSLKVPDRLMRLFGRLAEDHGVMDAKGVRIEVRLTHAQLASLVGSTRETVTLELSRLQRAGRIVMHGVFVVLPDMRLSGVPRPVTGAATCS